MTIIVVMAVLNGFRAGLLNNILGFTGRFSLHRQDRHADGTDGGVSTAIRLPNHVRYGTTLTIRVAQLPRSVGMVPPGENWLVRAKALHTPQSKGSGTAPE